MLRISPNVILSGRLSACVGVWRFRRGMPSSKRTARESQIVDSSGLETSTSYCLGVTETRAPIVYVYFRHIRNFLLRWLKVRGSISTGNHTGACITMLDTIRARYPGAVALRTSDDLDKYETAIEKFARGGSRTDFMATLFGIGIPADQIRLLASYPGRSLPAVCWE